MALDITPNELRAQILLHLPLALELNFYNPNDYICVFKVRTTQRRGHHIKPHQGVIQPKENIKCIITIDAMTEYPKDRALLRPKVQILSQRIDNSNNIPNNPMEWKHYWLKHTKDANDQRIKCKLSIPASIRADLASRKGLEEVEQIAKNGNNLSINTSSIDETTTLSSSTSSLKTPLSNINEIPDDPFAATITPAKKQINFASPTTINIDANKSFQQIQKEEQQAIDHLKEQAEEEQEMQQQQEPQQEQQEEEQEEEEVILPIKKMDENTVPKEWFNKASKRSAELEQINQQQKKDIITLKQKVKKFEIERDSLLGEVHNLSNRISQLNKKQQELTLLHNQSINNSLVQQQSPGEEEEQQQQEEEEVSIRQRQIKKKNQVLILLKMLL